VASFWQFLIPVISAAIGYVTNWVAIRMLFRPHNEIRVFGVRVPLTPGLIPKRREDVAASIGRAVSKYLLTEDAISVKLHKPEFRTQVHQLVERFGDHWLRRDLASVNELIPEKFRAEWERWVVEIKSRLDGWLETLFGSAQLHELIERQTEKQLKQWLETPIDELLPESLLAQAPEKLADVLQRVIEDENLEKRIDAFFSQRLDSVVEEDKSLADIIPPRLREIAYDKLEDATPMILERLVKILEDEQVRRRLKVQLFEMVDELLNRQFKEDSVWDQFKFGLMESFVISPEDLKARIEDGVDQAAPRMAELIRKDDVQKKVHQALIDAIDKFLNKPFSEFNVEADTMGDLKSRISGWITSLLHSDNMRQQLVKLVGDMITNNRSKSVVELLPAFTEDSVSRASEKVSYRIIQWLQGKPVRVQIERLLSNQVDVWLDQPIGRLDRFMADETLERAQDVVTDQSIELLIRETPEIVERLNIEQLVAERVEEFSLPEVERMIMGITGRQLKAITWFGALLGFVIGLLQMMMLIWQSS
jgi:uncharacterized membrane protein YheB (UPF0754 family)